MKNLFEKLNSSCEYAETAAAMHRQGERNLQERVLEECRKKKADKRRLDPNDPNG
jgi:hypothetical protein